MILVCIKVIVMILPESPATIHAGGRASGSAHYS